MSPSAGRSVPLWTGGRVRGARRCGGLKLRALRSRGPAPRPGGRLPAAEVSSTGHALESVDLLDGGDQAYPRMLLAIAGARRSVHLEVYAFASSGVGARFVDALATAARRGVGVRVVIDGWGSMHSGRRVARALRAAGCTVRIYNRLRAMLVGRFGRNHRKILLVDDEVAFLGGINIGNENMDAGVRPAWADLALEIRGPQCLHLGQMIRRERQRPISSAMRIDLSGLGGGWRLRRRYLRAFARAQQRIHVAHGYFLPDLGVVRAITAAARRGVEVRLLLAGRSDVPFARAATRSLYRQLLAAGVRIHEWSGSVLHAKVATVDGRRLLVGSFNLDPFSLANLEVLVEVADPRIVAQGEAWIGDYVARSRAMTSVEAGSRLHRWLLDPLGRLVARLADALSRIVASPALRRSARDRSLTPQSAWVGQGPHVEEAPHALRPAARGPGAQRLASGGTEGTPHGVVRRVATIALGLGVLALGVSLLVLPGPAFVVIPLGLAILATEFGWARRLLAPLRRVLRRTLARARLLRARRSEARRGRGGTPTAEKGKR